MSRVNVLTQHGFQLIFSSVHIPKQIVLGGLKTIFLFSSRDLNISKTILQTEINLFIDGLGSVSFSLFYVFLFATAKMMLACYKGTCFLMTLKHILIVNKQLYSLKLCN